MRGLTLILQLLLLLLEHLLLLGRIHVLEGMSIEIDALRHPAHQGRVYLSSWSRHSELAAGKLWRHGSPRRALLTGLGRHPRAHGMTRDARMAHGGRVPREVWAHACRHHV